MANEIRPQAGPQSRFLANPADIAIFGGAAGGGKSFGLLLDPLRYTHNPQFGAVLFRRTKVQIRNEGGLWDESESLFPLLGAHGFRQQLRWRFPSGATITMSHLEHDKDRFNWGGSQIPYIGFDEMTHFCLTADHEVLTKRGWVAIADVKLSDRVWSKRNGDSAEFVSVTATHRFPFSG